MRQKNISLIHKGTNWKSSIKVFALDCDTCRHLSQVFLQLNGRTFPIPFSEQDRYCFSIAGCLIDIEWDAKKDKRSSSGKLTARPWHAIKKLGQNLNTCSSCIVVDNLRYIFFLLDLFLSGVWTFSLTGPLTCYLPIRKTVSFITSGKPHKLSAYYREAFVGFSFSFEHFRIRHWRVYAIKFHAATPVLFIWISEFILNFSLEQFSF